MLQSRKIHVKIEGMEPGYMQSRVDPHDLIRAEKKKTGNKSADPRNIEEETQHKLFLNKEKIPCIPYEHLYSGLINAAKDFRIGGKGAKSYREVFASSVKVEPALIPINPPTWETDLRVANNFKAGRIAVARPKFPGGWTAEFDIIVEDEQITDETVKQVLEHCGSNKGIGSFRPTQGGPFGRFITREFNTI